MSTDYCFRYQQLLEGELRLIRLHSGTRSSVINCTLLHISHQNQPAYFALSYTWGDPKNTWPILLNGRTFFVTVNLEHALRAIRYQLGGGLFWIDSICINQQDIEERNEQVVRMRDIYGSAADVVVWLGLGNERSDKVIDYMTANEELVLQHSEETQTEEIKWEIWWVMVEELLSRPWWSCLWVIQEVAVAKDIQIFCGYKSLRWGVLGEGIKISIEHHARTKMEGELYSALNRAVELRNIRTRWKRSAATVDWKELLLRARASQSSLLVDKLYGLLSLATQEQLPGFTADYKAPVFEVFRQFTVLLLMRDQRLDFICLNGGRKSPEGLPSWTPDLSAIFRTKPLNKMRVESRYKVQFDANATADEAGKLQKDVNTRFNFSESLDILYADGIRADVITILSLDMEYKDVSWDNLYSLYLERATQCVSEVSDINAEYVLGGGTYEALLRTLVADNSAMTSRKDSSSALDHQPENHNSQNPVTVYWANSHRRFMKSQNGYFGLVPQHSRIGDFICMLFGCDVPVVLRQMNGYHIFIGECYVHGLMDGFIFKEWRRGRLLKQTFSIH